MKIDYSVRCVPSYQVGKFYTDGNMGGSEGLGQYTNIQTALQVATAMAKADQAEGHEVTYPLELPKLSGGIGLSAAEAENLREHGYEDADLVRVAEAHQYHKMGDSLRAMVAEDVIRRTRSKPLT